MWSVKHSASFYWVDWKCLEENARKRHYSHIAKCIGIKFCVRQTKLFFVSIRVFNLNSTNFVLTLMYDVYCKQIITSFRLRDTFLTVEKIGFTLFLLIEAASSIL